MKGPKGLALLLSPDKGEKGSAPEETEMDEGAELEDAMSDLIDAIESKDAKAAALAFQRAKEC